MINPAARAWLETPIGRATRLLGMAARRRAARVTWARWQRRLWWPFEASSELAGLQAEGTSQPYPTFVSDRTANALLMQLQRVQRRLQQQQLIILVARTLWLALLVSLVLLLGRFLMAVPGLVIVLGAALVGLGAVLYARWHRITTWTAARLLDRHWRLQEQLTTAIELAIAPAPGRLASRQIGRALETMQTAQTQHRLRLQVPWAELQLALALGLLVAGLNLASGPSERLVAPAALLSPSAGSTVDLSSLGAQNPEIAIMEGTPGAFTEEYAMGGLNPGDISEALGGIDPEALREAAELSRRSSQELSEIANAIKDASVTSGAAQSIQAGDYQRASEQIAELAKSVESLSPEARKDLAERLKAAAQNVQAMDPELARRLEQASKAMASRSDRAAAQGLEDLSKAISETGKNVLPQSALGAAMDQIGGEGAAGEMGDENGPGRSASSPAPGEGAPGALGEGDPGQYGFESAEGVLSMGANTGGLANDGSGGAGAGQGAGAENSRYTPSSNPNADRVEVRTDTGSGPSAQRPGRNPNGQPDIITTGPGATGPGQQTQTGLPISTGLDANRVPRPLRSVVEGYFRSQPTQPSQPTQQAPR